MRNAEFPSPRPLPLGGEGKGEGGGKVNIESGFYILLFLPYL